MRRAHIGSYVCVPGPQLGELFGKDWEVWPCWGSESLGEGFKVFKAHTRAVPSPCLPLTGQDVKLTATAQHHPCLLRDTVVTEWPSKTVSKPPI